MFLRRVGERPRSGPYDGCSDWACETSHGRPDLRCGRIKHTCTGAGDVLLVISNSGETEIVAGWCKNFKRMGATVASIVGNPDSTIAATSDLSFTIKGNGVEGKPNSFYIKTAFALSPLPIYLVEKVGERGLDCQSTYCGGTTQ